MQDELAAQSAALGDNDEIRAILEEVCQITQMGFSAVARVTDSRWIVCNGTLARPVLHWRDVPPNAASALSLIHI